MCASCVRLCVCVCLSVFSMKNQKEINTAIQTVSSKPKFNISYEACIKYICSYDDNIQNL